MRLLLIAAIVVVMFTASAVLPTAAAPAGDGGDDGKIVLPGPVHDAHGSVEEALSKRRSVREYSDEPLRIAEVSQLLWAAQGVTDPGGFRTAPSAGALYPLEVYVVVGNVEGVTHGVYRYLSSEHALERVAGGDRRADLSRAALGQASVKDAAIDIVFAGVYERTTGKYGTQVRDEATGASCPRGVQYVHLEAGHAAQNLCLQAVPLDIGTVAIGGFSDEEVKVVTRMKADERPLYILATGKIQPPSSNRMNFRPRRE